MWIISYRPGSFRDKAFSIIRQKKDLRVLSEDTEESIFIKRDNKYHILESKSTTIKISVPKYCTFNIQAQYSTVFKMDHIQSLQSVDIIQILIPSEQLDSGNYKSVALSEHVLLHEDD